MLTLLDTGVRAAELCGMKVEDVDWKDLSIKVTGKAGKERYVGIGHKTAPGHRAVLAAQAFG